MTSVSEQYLLLLATQGIVCTYGLPDEVFWLRLGGSLSLSRVCLPLNDTVCGGLFPLKPIDMCAFGCE